MRRHVCGVHGGDDDARVGGLGSVAAGSADDSYDGGAGFFGELDGADEVGADVLFQIATADGEDDDAVFAGQSTAFKPAHEDRLPAFVVHAGGEFRDVVGGTVGFEAGDFAE